MTVKYIHDSLTNSQFGTGIGKLLFRWKGSIYRLLWADFLVYVCLYALVSIIYRLALNKEQKLVFEDLVHYSASFSESIPLGFILGFYCSVVAGRWWMQFQAIPSPDDLCNNVTIHLIGQDDDARMMRRNIARYANLAINISLKKMAPRARDRFATLDRFEAEGFLTSDEKVLLKKYHEETKNCKSITKDDPLMSDFWIPLVWASSIANRARKENKFLSDLGYRAILADLASLRSKCAGVEDLAEINIPLVYGQVVTIGVYSFFLNTLIGRQFTDKEFDPYIPFFTLLEFLFYMGWLKTAETMINPFGDDDDDFEILQMIDKNHEMGYIIVDKLNGGHPELSRDKYWDHVIPPKEAIEEIEDMPNRRKDKYVTIPEPANDDVVV